MATQADHGAGIQASVRSSDTRPATLPEIGISRQRASEMKKMAEAGEPAIREEVKRATSEGRRPSRNRLLNRIPAIAARPPEFTQFALWLRTGADLLARIGPAATLAARLTEHGMAIPTNHISGVGDFLRAMEVVHEEA
ncbi:hypothetical protein AAFN86_08505 [Roseomonas sp. CAU 1739]|uniref:hypothetical protein n=1 Tax=Roseomonas sp. CAU 1739 TaxID=3140364 RepID=UPI00325BEF6E